MAQRAESKRYIWGMRTVEIKFGKVNLGMTMENLKYQMMEFEFYSIDSIKVLKILEYRSGMIRSMF